MTGGKLRLWCKRHFGEVRRMKMRVIAMAAALGMALLDAPLARSHHSNVAFEVTKYSHS
jgi:hypothetical protein